MLMLGASSPLASPPPHRPLTMRYAILRTQKLKATSAVARSLKHAFREQDTPNADQAKTPENSHIGAASSREALDRFAALLPDKVRKNGVLAIEYLVTASPEAMHGKTREQQDAYFRDALAWLHARHGRENVFYAGVHRDELTPHMYAYVVPLDERGRLNARAFLGGSKALTQMQSEFAAKVGRAHGLERGIERSKAQHQTVRQFYAQIQQPAQHVRIDASDIAPKTLEKGLLRDRVETLDQVADRLSKAVQRAYTPAVEGAKATQMERRRAREMADTAKVAQAREAEFERLGQAARGKAAEAAAELKTLMGIVARGGDALVRLQTELRERMARAQQKRRDGLER